MKIWMTAWEWQCCGEPFTVGSNVAWGLLPVTDALRSQLAQVYGDDIGRVVTHYETHHDDDPEPIPTLGRVDAIEAAYCVYQSTVTDPRYFTPVAGTGRLELRDSADGWEPEDDPTSDRRRKTTFEGYIVQLSPLDASGES